MVVWNPVSPRYEPIITPRRELQQALRKRHAMTETGDSVFVASAHQSDADVAWNTQQYTPRDLSAAGSARMRAPSPEALHGLEEEEEESAPAVGCEAQGTSSASTKSSAAPFKLPTLALQNLASAMQPLGYSSPPSQSVADAGDAGSSAEAASSCDGPRFAPFDGDGDGAPRELAELRERLRHEEERSRRLESLASTSEAAVSRLQGELDSRVKELGVWRVKADEAESVALWLKGELDKGGRSPSAACPPIAEEEPDEKATRAATESAAELQELRERLAASQKDVAFRDGEVTWMQEAMQKLRDELSAAKLRASELEGDLRAKEAAATGASEEEQASAAAAAEAESGLKEAVKQLSDNLAASQRDVDFKRGENAWLQECTQKLRDELSEEKLKSLELERSLEAAKATSELATTSPTAAADAEAAAAAGAELRKLREVLALEQRDLEFKRGEVAWLQECSQKLRAELDGEKQRTSDLERTVCAAHRDSAVTLALEDEVARLRAENARLRQAVGSAKGLDDTSRSLGSALRSRADSLSATGKSTYEMLEDELAEHPSSCFSHLSVRAKFVERSQAAKCIERFLREAHPPLTASRAACIQLAAAKGKSQGLPPLYDPNSPDFGVSLLEIPVLLSHMSETLAACAEFCQEGRQEPDPLGITGGLDATRRIALPLRVADPDSWPQVRGSTGDVDKSHRLCI